MWKPQNEPEKLQGIPIGIPSKKQKAQSNSQGGGSYNESTGLQNTNANVSLAKSEPSGTLKKPTLGPFMRAKIGTEMVKLQPHGGDSQIFSFDSSRCLRGLAAASAAESCAVSLGRSVNRRGLPHAEADGDQLRLSRAALHRRRPGRSGVNLARRDASCSLPHVPERYASRHTAEVRPPRA